VAESPRVLLNHLLQYGKYKYSKEQHDDEVYRAYDSKKTTTIRLTETIVTEGPAKEEIAGNVYLT
jgi:translation initiation factor IF-3